MSASNTAENLVLEWLLTTNAVSRPTTWYLAVYTAAPSDTGGGTEVSGFGYARQAITFSAPTAGTLSNNVAVEFDCAGGNWGSITHWAVHTDISADSILVYDAMVTPKTINDGDTLRFAIGDVDISCD